MPITVHPDLWGHSFTAYFFAYKGEINIYDFLLSLPKDYPLVANFGVSDIFIYPPLTYFTLGIFRFLIRPLADANFIPWLMVNVGHFYNYSNLGVQLFLFKLPYLFIDVASAFVLSKLFNDPKKKKTAFALWMFNPVTIYATFMIGQFDIIPVFFTLLSCYLAKNKKPGWGVFMLGIGGAYKMYPLLLIPAAAFLLGETFWKKVKLMGIGIFPYLLTIFPFLWSKGFRSMVLFGSKETKMLFMKFNMTGAEAIFPFILGLVIIYLISYYSKRKIHLEYYFLSIIFLIFAVSSYHPQWFLWLTPFLIYALVKKSFKYVEIIVVLFVSWLLITLTFEASLSYGLFSPIWHTLTNAPSLGDILAKYVDVYQFKSIIRSIFAGTGLFYIYKLFKNEDIQEQ